MNLVDEIAIALGAPRSEIVKIIATAPRRYKTYPIPKRSGGFRVIAQPASELKLIQRFLVREKLSLFPIHRIATAYTSQKGIIDNALAHAHTKFTLKLDFSSFFPSIVPRDLERVNRTISPMPLDRGDLETYYRLLFWGDGENAPKKLSIGAPSSPMLSNIVMYQLDSQIAEAAERMGLVVTRYADDIAVSGHSLAALVNFEKSFRRIIKLSASPRLQINEAKRGIYGSGERRMITGLIITPDGKVSMGRDRKRSIAALIHQFVIGASSEQSLMYTKGMLGFAIAVEPGFVSSMRKKYGDAAINTILSADVARGTKLDKP